MKNTIVLFIFLFSFITLSFAQEQEKLFELHITKFIQNGVDYTNWATQRQQSLVFYKHKGNKSLANYCNTCTDQTQSHGRVYSFTKVDSKSETEEKYAYAYYTFTWAYFNTYDDVSGSANVDLFVIHKPDGSTFQLTITLANKETLEYEGFVEGTVR